MMTTRARDKALEAPIRAACKELRMRRIGSGCSRNWPSLPQRRRANSFWHVDEARGLPSAPACGRHPSSAPHAPGDHAPSGPAGESDGLDGHVRNASGVTAVGVVGGEHVEMSGLVTPGLAPRIDPGEVGRTADRFWPASDGRRMDAGGRLPAGRGLRIWRVTRQFA
jgi:hypothetical protein